MSLDDPPPLPLTEADVRNGDLLLFAGRGMEARGVRLATGSHLSHVGTAYRCPVTDRAYIWECGAVPDQVRPLIALAGSSIGSAHLAPLAARLRHCSGQAFVRPLLRVDAGRNDDGRGRADAVSARRYAGWIARHVGTPYGVDFVSHWNQRDGFSLLPLSFIEPPASQDADEECDDGWICSQLVALTYAALGVLELDRPSQTFMPGDFWSDAGEGDENGLCARPPYVFGSPLRLVSSDREREFG